MLYCDNPSNLFWDTLDDSSLNNNADERKRIFAKMFGIDESRVIGTESCNWAKVPWINTSIHFWKVGFNKYSVCEKLRKFQLKGQTNNSGSIHVSGGAYSHGDGFVEGALRSVHDLLENDLLKK